MGRKQTRQKIASLEISSSNTFWFHPWNCPTRMLAITEQAKPRGGQAETLVPGRHMWGPGKSAEAEWMGKGHGFRVRGQSPGGQREGKPSCSRPDGTSDLGTGRSAPVWRSGLEPGGVIWAGLLALMEADREVESWPRGAERPLGVLLQCAPRDPEDGQLPVCSWSMEPGDLHIPLKFGPWIWSQKVRETLVSPSGGFRADPLTSLHAPLELQRMQLNEGEGLNGWNSSPRHLLQCLSSSSVWSAVHASLFIIALWSR